MDLTNIDFSPERTIDAIIKFLKDASFAIRLNFYTKDFTLSNILSALDDVFPNERIQFKSDREFELALFYVNYWKTEIKYLFKSPSSVAKVEKSLSQFGYDLLQDRCSTEGYLDPLEILIKEPEISEALKEAKFHLKKGQLVNCLDVFPESYFQANVDGIFTYSPTSSAIRKIFGYYTSRIPNLEDIGFIYSTEESRFKIITDIVTKEIHKFSSNAFTPVNYHGIDVLQQRHGYITFFRITGIDKNKHNKAIIELNKQNRELLTSVHSRPHKPHKAPKPYAKHKPRTAPRRDAEVYFDETGEHLTVAAYALKNHISVKTARSRLRKLASLPVQKEPNELEWFLS